MQYCVHRQLCTDHNRSFSDAKTKCLLMGRQITYYVFIALAHAQLRFTVEVIVGGPILASDVDENKADVAFRRQRKERREYRLHLLNSGFVQLARYLASNESISRSPGTKRLSNSGNTRINAVNSCQFVILRQLVDKMN